MEEDKEIEEAIIKGINSLLLRSVGKSIEQVIGVVKEENCIKLIISGSKTKKLILIDK